MLGHLFERGETRHLIRVIEFGLILGWDAVVTAKPKLNLLSLSHDDCLEIFAGFHAHRLARKLIALGYWHEQLLWAVLVIGGVLLATVDRKGA